MECPICLGPLNRCPDGIEDNIRRRLTNIRSATCCCTPCGHIFHKACLLHWLDRSNRPPCPVCNVKLSKMKLYPAYLNVDKGDTTGPRMERNEVDDSTRGYDGGGAGASPTLITANNNISVESNASSLAAFDFALNQNRSGGSINATTTIGCNCVGICSMSHNAPVACGVATMTLGTYAITSLGPVPVVTATTIGIGTSAGAMIPPAHSNSQSVGLESSAYMTFPQSNPNLLSRPPVSRTFASSWGTGSGSETTITNTISTEQDYPFRGGTSITTTILGNSFRPSVIKSSFCGIDGAPPTHYNRDGGNARHHPYLQPPPAHSMSTSSFSRRNDATYNMFYNNVFDAGENSRIEVGVPHSQTYGHSHTSDEYDDGLSTRTET